MLCKNTLIDLWSMLGDVPTVINDEMKTVIDDDFLGWPAGTEVETVWHWFDAQFAAFGGVHVLMYDHPEPDLKFQVYTPAGILEVSYEDWGNDEKGQPLYPGVEIRLIRPKEENLYDLICRVEYDEPIIQTLCYVPDQDEPISIRSYDVCRTYADFLKLYQGQWRSLMVRDQEGNEIPAEMNIPDDARILEWSRSQGEYDVTLDIDQVSPMTFGTFLAKYGNEIVTLDAYDENGDEYPGDDADNIPDDAIVLKVSRFGDAFEVTLKDPKAIPERISKDIIRRGLTDGDIEITKDPDGSGLAAMIGEHWFVFDEDAADDGPDGAITASAHIDTTPFEEDVEAIWEAINAEPINGPTEDTATECLYYKALLQDRFRVRDNGFKGHEVQYPIEEQIDACYRYLNWTDSHKDPFEMTEDELIAAEKELAECFPGIAWVAHAGYVQTVPQDKQTGQLILT